MNHFLTLCIIGLAASTAVLADFECPKPGNEATFWPDPVNCSEYIECFAGKASIMECPPDLWWNQEKQYCDYKSNVDCKIDPSAPTEAPRTRATQATRPSDFTPDPNCPYPSDIITYDYVPGNCSEYYECDHGLRYLEKCPANRLWNHIKNYCDFPDEVDCSRAPVATTTPGPSTAPSQVCVGQKDGTLLPDADDCAKYYECLRGQAIEFTCPDGTLWDQDEQVCDYPSRVDCKVTPKSF
ncbi:peritrophin-1-like isoform X1 [Diabrotica virgifera virgifera]|uniref:Chitin-binding type-2 domain-containing protein n=1 Tax=Diabrotica virgifera virgifera TaxID=50390 RepID=A0ABM5KE58_DIAVI|nr:peritrophin-1-like isoform X1 [Diabrotica virgifera virgifera]